MKTELSKKSEYYIPKHRRMELAHFCRQYPDWISERISLLYMPQKSEPDLSCVHSGNKSDMSFDVAER